MPATQEQVIEVGRALLPYLRNDLTDTELGTATHDAAAALSRTVPQIVRAAPEMLKALREIAALGKGPDRGSAQWQIDCARDIAEAAIARALGEAS